jgi:large conductance mechanosensitive channel
LGDAPGRSPPPTAAGYRCRAATARLQCGRFFHDTRKRSLRMSFASEFKEFALKGNVMDLAVGVIIGAAFGKIVDSAVKDLLMPVVNFALGGQIDFANKYWVLAGQVPAGASLAEAQKVGTVFAWGNFATITINFIVLALVIFWMVKAMNRVKRETPPPPPTAPAEDIVLLREIRDALKK